MIVGVKISGINDSNRQAAIAFIQANLLMELDAIKTALTIPGFIFYSNKFNTIVLTGYPFTIASVTVAGDIYVNIAGGRLQFPYSKNLDGTINYATLKASDYYLKSSVSTDPEIVALVADLVKNRYVTVVDGDGDFNNDFASAEFL